jgi:hypothetical protein
MMARTLTCFVRRTAAASFRACFDAYDTSPQTWVPVAGPLPGNPVAFGLSAPAITQMFGFGQRCSPLALTPL